MQILKMKDFLLRLFLGYSRTSAVADSSIGFNSGSIGGGLGYKFIINKIAVIDIGLYGNYLYIFDTKTGVFVPSFDLSVGVAF